MTQVPHLFSVRNITKTFMDGGKRNEILSNVGLDIPQGISLLGGRTGSGKTTFLNILGATDVPDSGIVEFMGEQVDWKTEEGRYAHRRFVGRVFQEFHLEGHKTAMRNVMVPMEFGGLMGGRRAEMRERACGLLKKVGLEGKEKRYPSELSGGERQRVSIARALAGESKVILADEPTGNLDRETAVQIMDLLCSLWKGEGVSIIVVTHDIEMIRGYCTAAFLCRGGGIVRAVFQKGV